MHINLIRIVVNYLLSAMDTGTTDNRIHQTLYGVLNHFAWFQCLNQYRRGYILEAQKTMSQSCWPSLFRHRITEIAAVIENATQFLAPLSFPIQSFNGNVLLVLHNSRPHDRAGYAVRSHSIATNLVRLGLHLTVVTRPGYPWDLSQHARLPDEQYSEVDGIRYLRLEKGKGPTPREPDSAYVHRYANALARLVRQTGSTVIHAASSFVNGLAAAQAAQLTGTAAIYEMRGLWHLSRVVKEPGFDMTGLFRYCEIQELAAARQSHAVVCISDALKAYLVQNGLNKNRIHVIPNAVDTTLFLPQSPDRNLQHKFRVNGRTVIGFIGSLTGYEGLESLLAAVLELLEQGLPMSLIIVGQGDLEARLWKMAETSSHGRHIHFTGFVPFDEIRRYYSVMDIMPLPRSDLPVCRLVPPLKILEIMAMGKAVIVSDLAPLREMVTHEKTGLICPPDNVQALAACLQRLAESPRERSALGHAAMTWVRENRTWSANSRSYIQLYTSMMENR